jgi:FkbM family methyltransferase
MKSIANLAHLLSSHPLTRGARWKAWMRFGSWQIRSRLQHELILPWIEGQRLVLRRGMTGGTGNIYTGLHEFCDMMLLLHFLREGDLFLDVGANVGSFTVLASGVRKATTWAFEPDPTTIRGLRRNIEINGIQDRVIVHELALGRSNGLIPFTVGLDTMNRLARSDEVSIRKVSVRKLDCLIGARQPIMVKIDVEGLEESVVQGARELISGTSIKIIEVETVVPETEAFLQSAGFGRAYYDPFHRALATHPFAGLASSNAVFVRDWESVCKRLTSAPPIRVLGQSI